MTVLHLASMYGHYKIVGKILTLIGHSDISPVKKYLNQSLLVNKQTQVSTGLPAKSDSDVMFCLQSNQGLRINRSLVY